MREEEEEGIGEESVGRCREGREERERGRKCWMQASNVRMESEDGSTCNKRER